MSCSLITRIASRRKSGSKPSPTLRRYSSSATLTSVIGASFVVDLHTHEEAPMTVCCQPLFTPPAETLSVGLDQPRQQDAQRAVFSIEAPWQARSTLALVHGQGFRHLLFSRKRSDEECSQTGLLLK